MATSRGCGELLEWDSAFFERRIGRIHASTLTEGLMRDIEQWAADAHIECLYFLADPTDRLTVQLAAERRFELTDIRVTLESASHAVTPVRETPVVRPWGDGDVPALRRLAAASHRDSRFYYDRHLAREQCDRLYATWIEKSCLGYADVVLVADLAGEPVGYVSLHRRAPSAASIGLIAVDPSMRGVGCGRALIASALEWSGRHGLRPVTVVTQARNVHGLRLYERCGFVTTSVQLWYHWWPAADGGSR